MASQRGDRGDDPPADLGPLPGGHHGLSREQIADSQREPRSPAPIPGVAGRKAIGLAHSLGHGFGPQQMLAPEHAGLRVSA
jgi:hypothetical protein